MSLPNWFQHYAAGHFDRHLGRYAGNAGLRFLQIGAFTGDASDWMLRHVLTGEGSTLTDVDTWEGSDEPEHEPLDFGEVERLYNRRAANWGARLVKFKGTSERFWRSHPTGYDFIYIDGDHTARGVLNDAVHAYDACKPGGLIAFDDYLWKSGNGRLHDPAPAIDAFADLYSDRLEVLETGLQVWFRKMVV